MNTHKKHRKTMIFRVGVLAFMVGTFITMFALYHAGLVVNHSKSMPLGLYIRTQNSPEKGDLIVLSAPDTDFTRNTPGFPPRIIKKLAGVHADIVTINDDGVIINGNMQINSKPIKHPDLSPAYILNHHLAETEAIVLSDYSPLSYDSRYFGPISTTLIISVIKPLFVW